MAKNYKKIKSKGRKYVNSKAEVVSKKKSMPAVACSPEHCFTRYPKPKRIILYLSREST